MQRTNWFDRTFPPITDNGVLPCIIERLSGTPARLHEKLIGTSIDLTRSDSTEKWSISQEVGHLIDLEPLWLQRVRDIMAGNQHLTIADLSNTKTYQADHNSRSIAELIQILREQRQLLITALQEAEDEHLERSAVHPRLGMPMRIVDIAFFVAEHDDHHLAQMTYLLRKYTVENKPR